MSIYKEQKQFVLVPSSIHDTFNFQSIQLCLPQLRLKFNNDTEIKQNIDCINQLIATMSKKPFDNYDNEGVSRQ